LCLEWYVYPQKALKHPPRCRALGRVPLLIGERLSFGLKTLSDAPFQSRIDRQAERHHHQKRHNPPLALKKEGGGHKPCRGPRRRPRAVRCPRCTSGAVTYEMQWTTPAVGQPLDRQGETRTHTIHAAQPGRILALETVRDERPPTRIRGYVSSRSVPTRSITPHPFRPKTYEQIPRNRHHAMSCR